MTVHDGRTQHEFAAGGTIAIIGVTVKEGGCYAYARLSAGRDLSVLKHAERQCPNPRSRVALAIAAQL